MSDRFTYQDILEAFFAMRRPRFVPKKTHSPSVPNEGVSSAEGGTKVEDDSNTEDNKPVQTGAKEPSSPETPDNSVQPVVQTPVQPSVQFSAPKYNDYIADSASRYGINPELLTRLIQVESNFDPNALSPAGAVGLTQVVPKWHPTADLSTPQSQIDYGAKYLSELHGQLGDWRLALAAYNGGIGRLKQNDMDISRMPQETQDYVKKFGYDDGGYIPRFRSGNGNQNVGYQWSDAPVDGQISVQNPISGISPISVARNLTREEKQEQLSTKGILNEQSFEQNEVQKRLYNNLRPSAYDKPLRRVYDAVVNNEPAYGSLGQINKSQDVVNDWNSNLGRIRAAQWNMYMGKPQDVTLPAFKVSDYTPSMGGDPEKTYYAFHPEVMPQKKWEYLIKDYEDPEYRKGNLTDKGNVLMDYDILGLGKYTFGKGADDKGEYYSYYDKWDLPFDFGKPFEIYDRYYPDANTSMEGKRAHRNIPRHSNGGHIPQSKPYNFDQGGYVPKFKAGNGLLDTNNQIADTMSTSVNRQLNMNQPVMQPKSKTSMFSVADATSNTERTPLQPQSQPIPQFRTINTPYGQIQQPWQATGQANLSMSPVDYAFMPYLHVAKGATALAKGATKGYNLMYGGGAGAGMIHGSMNQIEKNLLKPSITEYADGGYVPVFGYKKGGWIQKATTSIKRRGTEGVCTGAKFGSASCPKGSRRYNLAVTFRSMARKRKNK